MNDDSWRDSYDVWKLASPYDEYDDEPECYHEDYDIDILEGRTYCNSCSESWYATEEQIAREIEHQREYAEWEDRQRRREFWRKLTLPIRWPVYRLLERIWPRKACSVLTNDEIPF
jgi:hypothetical protein